ncbi:3090_t:CDS:2 [Entrophospora sp. SA101]|nr:3090_t:CDS:2 [Entrophospora sp. SA101]
MAENSKFMLNDAFHYKLIKSIPYVELEGLTKIDCGKFGSISVAYWPKIRKKVAVKRLLAFEEDDTSNEKFFHELQIQKRVEYHDNIIRILGISQDPCNKDRLLVLQYAKDGNLRDYLARKHSTFTWNDRFKIAFGIADGLNCLHDENIVHCDLHSRNILIDNGEPKIADFGISKNLDTMSNSVNGVFGMIPYIEPKQTPVIGTPQEYVLLYQECWNKTPQLRPNIYTVLQSLERITKCYTESIEATSPILDTTSPTSDRQITQRNIDINTDSDAYNSLQYNLVIPDDIWSSECVKDLTFIDIPKSTMNIDLSQPSQTSKIVTQPTFFERNIEPSIETIRTSFPETDTLTTSGSSHNQAIISSKKNDQNSQNHNFTKVSRSSNLLPFLNKDEIRLKVVVIGSGAVGKSSLLEAFVFGKCQLVYIPTVFENFCVNVEIDGQYASLSLWDTAGQEDYEKLRAVSYPATHTFLVLFSVDCPDTLENVIDKWAVEVDRYSKSAPIILVGTKIDTRNDEKTIRYLQKSYRKPITYEEGSKVAKLINAVKYLECSALNCEGVNEVFEHAARTALAFSLIRKNHKKCIVS